MDNDKLFVKFQDLWSRNSLRIPNNPGHSWRMPFSNLFRNREPSHYSASAQSERMSFPNNLPFRPSPNQTTHVASNGDSHQTSALEPNLGHFSLPKEPSNFDATPRCEELPLVENMNNSNPLAFKAFSDGCSAFKAIIERKNVILAKIIPEDTPEMAVISILQILSYTLTETSMNLGPGSIIITYSSRTIDFIFKKSSEHLRSLKIITYHGKCFVNPETFENMIADCDVIITTLLGFRELLREISHLLKNLKRVVFDRIIRKNDIICKELHKTIETLNAHKSSQKEKMQYIFLQEILNLGSEELISSMVVNPRVFLTSPLLEAIHSGIKIKTLFGSKLELISSIPGIIKRFLKTIIVCDDKNVSDIELFLLNMFENVQGVNCSDSEQRLKGVKEVWFRTLTPFILVCPDEVLKMLNIFDVDCLINFSVPKPLSVFFDRFLVFKHHIRDFRLNLEPKMNLNFKSYIFVLTDDIKSIDINTMRAIDKISVFEDREVFVTTFKAILKKIEKTTIHRPLCQNMLQFAECRSFPCTYRHTYISERDKPKFHLSKGTVLLNSLEVINPCLYKANILGKSDKTGLKVLRLADYELYYPQYYYALQRYLFLLSCEKDPNNLKKMRAKTGVIGGVYAVRQNAESDFELGEVVKITRSDSVYRIHVELLDSGEEILLSLSDLYTIPTLLRNIPSQNINVVITNLRPSYKEDYWCYDANRLMRKFICNENPLNIFDMYKAEILYTMGSTIFVNDLTRYNFEDSIFKMVFSVKSVLLIKGLAVEEMDSIQISSHLKIIDANKKKELLNTSYQQIEDSNKISLPKKMMEKPVEDLSQAGSFENLCAHSEEVKEKIYPPVLLQNGNRSQDPWKKSNANTEEINEKMSPILLLNAIKPLDSCKKSNAITEEIEQKVTPILVQNAIKPVDTCEKSNANTEEIEEKVSPILVQNAIKHEDSCKKSNAITEEVEEKMSSIWLQDVIKPEDTWEKANANTEKIKEKMSPILVQNAIQPEETFEKSLAPLKLSAEKMIEEPAEIMKIEQKTPIADKIALYIWKLKNIIDKHFNGDVTAIDMLYLLHNYLNRLEIRNFGAIPGSETDQEEIHGEVDIPNVIEKEDTTTSKALADVDDSESEISVEDNKAIIANFGLEIENSVCSEDLYGTASVKKESEVKRANLIEKEADETDKTEDDSGFEISTREEESRANIENNDLESLETENVVHPENSGEIFVEGVKTIDQENMSGDEGVFEKTVEEKFLSAVPEGSSKETQNLNAEILPSFTILRNGIREEINLNDLFDISLNSLSEEEDDEYMEKIISYLTVNQETVQQEEEEEEKAPEDLTFGEDSQEKQENSTTEKENKEEQVLTSQGKNTDERHFLSEENLVEPGNLSVDESEEEQALTSVVKNTEDQRFLSEEKEENLVEPGDLSEDESKEEQALTSQGKNADEQGNTSRDEGIFEKNVEEKMPLSMSEDSSKEAENLNAEILPSFTILRNGIREEINLHDLFDITLNSLSEEEGDEYMEKLLSYLTVNQETVQQEEEEKEPEDSTFREDSIEKHENSTTEKENKEEQVLTSQGKNTDERRFLSEENVVEPVDLSVDESEEEQALTSQGKNADEQGNTSGDEGIFEKNVLFYKNAEEKMALSMPEDSSKETQNLNDEILPSFTILRNGIREEINLNTFFSIALNSISEEENEDYMEKIMSYLTVNQETVQQEEEEQKAPGDSTFGEDSKEKQENSTAEKENKEEQVLNSQGKNTDERRFLSEENLVEPGDLSVDESEEEQALTSQGKNADEQGNTSGDEGIFEKNVKEKMPLLMSEDSSKETQNLNAEILPSFTILRNGIREEINLNDLFDITLNSLSEEEDDEYMEKILSYLTVNQETVQQEEEEKEPEDSTFGEDSKEKQENLTAEKENKEEQVLTSQGNNTDERRFLSEENLVEPGDLSEDESKEEQALTSVVKNTDDQRFLSEEKEENVVEPGELSEDESKEEQALTSQGKNTDEQGNTSGDEGIFEKNVEEKMPLLMSEDSSKETQNLNAKISPSFTILRNGIREEINLNDLFDIALNSISEEEDEDYMEKILSWMTVTLK